MLLYLILDLTNLKQSSLSLHDFKTMGDASHVTLGPVCTCPFGLAIYDIHIFFFIICNYKFLCIC